MVSGGNGQHPETEGHFLHLSPLPRPQVSFWRHMITVAFSGTDPACYSCPATLSQRREMSWQSKSPKHGFRPGQHPGTPHKRGYQLFIFSVRELKSPVLSWWSTCLACTKPYVLAPTPHKLEVVVVHVHSIWKTGTEEPEV